MKKCKHCGLENADDATVCWTCKAELDPQPSPPATPPEYEMPPEEKRFWEKMTFRQFAVLIIRIQSLWLFFYAVIDLTYVPRYFPPASYLGTRPPLTTAGKIDFSMLILRIALYLAGGFLLIVKTECVLSWLVKDCIKPADPAQS